MSEPLDLDALSSVYPPHACGQGSAALIAALIAELRATRERNAMLHIAEQSAITRAERAEADIASVGAIENGNVCPHGYEPDERGCACYMCRVRAALRGDGA